MTKAKTLKETLHIVSLRITALEHKQELGIEWTDLETGYYCTLVAVQSALRDSDFAPLENLL